MFDVNRFLKQAVIYKMPPFAQCRLFKIACSMKFLIINHIESIAISEPKYDVHSLSFNRKHVYEMLNASLVD